MHAMRTGIAAPHAIADSGMTTSAARGAAGVHSEGGVNDRHSYVGTVVGFGMNGKARRQFAPRNVELQGEPPICKVYR